MSENDFVRVATDESTISSTSICLSVNGVDGDQIKDDKIIGEGDVAYDIGAYRDAPPGLRIWGGATVEPSDMEKLMRG